MLVCAQMFLQVSLWNLVCVCVCVYTVKPCFPLNVGMPFIFEFKFQVLKNHRKMCVHLPSDLQPGECVPWQTDDFAPDVTDNHLSSSLLNRKPTQLINDLWQIHKPDTVQSVNIIRQKVCLSSLC